MQPERSSYDIHRQQRSNRLRKKRGDVGITLFNERDEFALKWIGEQYGIRLDHLQWLLGRYPGAGAEHQNWISEGAARAVVERWIAGKWVQKARIRADEPFWVWPTRLGLQKVGLPYNVRNLAQTSLDDLRHLYAISEIRMHLDYGEEETRWISERQLLQGIIRGQGRHLLHRPDAEIHFANGEIIAIEVELSAKKPSELAENLMELLCGENYLHLKATSGWYAARALGRMYQSKYTAIWYFAPEKIRKLVRRERARLVEQGDLSQQDAERLFIRRYTLAETDEEMRQEQLEDAETINLTREEIDGERSERDETRPFTTKEERE